MQWYEFVYTNNRKWNVLPDLLVKNYFLSFLIFQETVEVKLFKEISESFEQEKQIGMSR